MKNFFDSQYIEIPSYQLLKNKEKNKKKKVIVIAGPTAVGKSRIAIKIAKIIKGEIISADSMQVYRNMNIGTAKIDEKERREVMHHLIDICDISESFSIIDFYREAVEALKEIFLKERAAIVVGGSGFYIQALLYGPPCGPPPSLRIRKKLEEEIAKKGLFSLYEKLAILDPEYAATITENDKHKIIRALEIIAISKKRVSSFRISKDSKNSEYDFRSWVLHMPKDILYKRVEKRCEEMIKKGFIDEVKKLENEGIRKNKIASKAIGYKQCLDFLEKGLNEKDFIENFKSKSKRYVKRQITWFLKDKNFRWLDLSKKKEENIIEYILQDYEQL